MRGGGGRGRGGERGGGWNREGGGTQTGVERGRGWNADGVGTRTGVEPRRGQAPSLHLVNVETGLPPVLHIPVLHIPRLASQPLLRDPSRGSRPGSVTKIPRYPRERASSRNSRSCRSAGGMRSRLRRQRPSSPLSQIASSILALKIDEYVPLKMPISSVSVNVRMSSLPKMVSADSVNSTVSEVFSERDIVCIRLASTICSKVSTVRRCMFSRMRSKTTIVSCTEKPTTVSKAVMKSESIWMVGKIFPRIEKTPSTTSTSCSIAIMAQVP